MRRCRYSLREGRGTANFVPLCIIDNGTKVKNNTKILQYDISNKKYGTYRGLFIFEIWPRGNLLQGLRCTASYCLSYPGRPDQISGTTISEGPGHGIRTNQCVKFLCFFFFSMNFFFCLMMQWIQKK